MPYKKLEIEEYLKTLHSYSEEQIDNVRKVRTEWEYASFEQVTFLFQQGLLNRKIKAKSPRSYYICPDNGNFYYLNHKYKWYILAFEWKQ